MDTNVRLEGIQLAVSPEVSVSAKLGLPPWWPSGHRVGVVLAHDLGASMEHPFLVALQTRLTQRGYLTLSFNFPFVEQGRKRPDPQQLLERAFRAAAATLVRDPQTAPVRIFLGGVGLGAKVATQSVTQGLSCDGLICLAYPLHPSGKPNQQRSEHLFRIICPMLFIQGSRDPYCRVDRLQSLLRRIGAPTLLHVVEDVDHQLVPIRRSPRPPEEVVDEVLGTLDGFIRKTLSGL